MKIFLDRHKTLLPRLDTIYLLSRVGALASIVWYALVTKLILLEPLLVYTVIGVSLTLFGVFWASIKGKFDIKLAYLASIISDILIIPTIILYSGGINSSFYLLLLLTITGASYLLEFWVAGGITVFVIAVYLYAVRGGIGVDTLFDISLRSGFFLISFLAISYVSTYMRRSEKRLLKLFDTLNKRTSELELSNARVEMIYENSRILASILEPDMVVKEVMRILGSVLKYTDYAIIFISSDNKMLYRSRAVGDKINFDSRAIESINMELIKRVCESDEPIRIKDIKGRDDYEPLNKNTRSLMVIPMNSHARIKGAITIESEEIGQFTELDLQMASIVARSAALALENAKLHKRTEELTIIDGLTGAYNYRYFIQKLQEEKRRATRYNLPVSLIMVDIDWFKKLNDTYGHEVGNIVLKELAKIIRSCIRDVDIFARYGGEEFVVILPQTSKDEAVVIGERIRRRVEKAVIITSQAGRLQITVSVGVSSFPENGRPQEELVSVADKALYKAKDEGRNHVCVV